MTPAFRSISAALLLFFIAIISSSCASKNFLVVNYQLPIETVEPQGTPVSLVFKDVRQNRAALTGSAKMALKKFTGNFALIVTRKDKSDKLIGAFSLGSMIREVFKQRLENAGIRVAPEEEYQEFTVEIMLKDFKIDLVSRKWVVNMTYQASFLKENKMITGETIKGSAERLRVVGGKDAEMITGELISDVANKLDLNEFLKLHEF
jgi:hypothetical protein